VENQTVTAARDKGTILITGATGFIGRHVARRLHQAGRRVTALARDQGGITAGRRIERALGIVVAGDGFEVIHSDLSRPGAGLSETEIARLRRTVRAVIHCAGNTSFFPQSSAASRALSIDGPLALLAALAAGRLERWCQISTAFVCGRRSGTVFEHEGALGQSFHNPYEGIKLESETALRESCRRLGVELRVLRPSVVVGAQAETKGAEPSNLLFQFIRLTAGVAARAERAEVDVRIQARPAAHFNIVPIEYVSAAIAALVDQAAAEGGTFHLVASNPPTQQTVLQMITSRLGVAGLRLIDARCEPLVRTSSLENKVNRMLAPYRDYLEQDVRFDDTAARSALKPFGISCPVIDQSMVNRLIDMALAKPAHGFRIERSRQMSFCA
jgi:nucleoside-diphosphate-sugar epimerase